MKKILVVGSINMDTTIYVENFPKDGETIFGNSRFVQPGGKGANQACAISKSGIAKCLFAGAVGRDDDGRAALSILKEHNVDTSNIKTANSETGNATIVVDQKSENKIIIIRGANFELSINDIPDDLISSVDFVVLQNEIPEEVNEHVIKTAHKFKKVIIYNPAPYRKINQKLYQYIDYFIPNKIELSQYSGIDNVEEGAKKLLNLGVKNMIVTLGTEGSMFINKDEHYKVDAFKVKAIDTVAAGDTFVGYFAASLASGYDIRTAMTIASKASSITVTRKGSIISIPNGDEVFD